MAPNIKVTRAYKAMKTFGYSSQIVKPVLKNLLDLYGQNLEFIEDEQYKILLDAIIESEECKGEKKKPQISDEHLEDGPPGRRYTLRSSKLHTFPSSSHPSPSFIEAAKKPLGSHGNQKLTDSSCHLGDTIIEAKMLCRLKNHQKAERGNSQNFLSEVELTEKTELTLGKDIDESDPRLAEIRLTYDANSDYSGSVVPNKVTSNAKGTSAVSWDEKNVKHKSNLKEKNDLYEYYAAATSETGQSPDDCSEFTVPLALICPGACFLCG